MLFYCAYFFDYRFNKWKTFVNVSVIQIRVFVILQLAVWHVQNVNNESWDKRMNNMFKNVVNWLQYSTKNFFFVFFYWSKSSSIWFNFVNHSFCDLFEDLHVFTICSSQEKFNQLWQTVICPLASIKQNKKKEERISFLWFNKASKFIVE